MLQEKSQEIRLMFLEEATENLNAIESAILVLAISPHVDNQRIDIALRAAHSIKGGAAMMGFQTLSKLAHSLEDFFKALKKQQQLIETEIEKLLLNAVAFTRVIVLNNRQGAVVNQQWLETQVNPVFEQLHLTLARNPTFENTATLPEDGSQLATGGERAALDKTIIVESQQITQKGLPSLPQSFPSGQDMAAMIFETEVEGCLLRLESVLTDPGQPCLLEETSTMAQELGGLGEMLKLTAFTSLCESVIQHLEATPERVEEIASLALSEWRRSQAAVLGGLVDTIPTSIDLVDLEDVSKNKPNRPSQVGNIIKLIPHLDRNLKCLLNLIGTLGSQVAVLQRFSTRRLPTYIKLPRTVLGDKSIFPLTNVPLLHWIASCKLEPSLEPKDKSPTAVPLPGQKTTILVVDDSESVLRLLSLTLETAGYQVELALDGQDALEKLDNGLQVQAVISDLEMPRIGGYSLLDRLKSNPIFKHLPILIMTDRDGEEYRRLAMNLGATAYFNKLYDNQKLIKKLSQVVNK